MLGVSPIRAAARDRARWRWPAALLVPAVAAWSGARAQTAAEAPTPAPIQLELNKLEPLPATASGAAASSGAASAAPAPGCRVYLVVTNPDPEPIAQLRLDLILFGTDGVITRRIALDLAPLAAHKTGVRLFDVAGQPCDGFGRVLVNDVLACKLGSAREGVPALATAETASQACLARLQLSSRAKAEFAK
jgi:hypothetical protein